MGNIKFINIESKHLFYLILLLSLWVTAASYFPISRDFANYSSWCLQSSESMEVAVERDPLFGISCASAGFIATDPIVLVAPFWILAALLLKFSAFLGEKKIFLWSLLTYVAFFFVTQEMTQIRAAVASAALGYAFVQLTNKKYMQSFCLFFVAVTAHFSSLALVPILLLLPLLIKTRLRFSITVIICQIVFIFSIFISELQGLLINILNELVGTDARIEAYLYYYEADDVTALYKNLRVGFFMIISALVLVKVALSRQYDNTKLIYGSTCLTSIAILILTLSYTVPVISLRSFELFSVPMSLMIGTYMESIENKYYAYIMSSILIVILVGTFYRSFILFM